MTAVEFLHGKGLKKWSNLQVIDENNKVVFLKELLEEYYETKQKLTKHGVMQDEGSDVSEGRLLPAKGLESQTLCVGNRVQIIEQLVKVV